jgi:hypothetical protein
MSKKLTIPGPDDEEGEASSREEEKLGWEFLFDFRAMAGELEARDDIVDVEWAIPDPVPNFTVETMEHGLGTSVPRFIKRFYRMADGLELSWNVRVDGEVVPGGGIELFDFATVFDSWLDTLWASGPETDEMDDREVDFLWSLRGFDGLGQPQGEDRQMVVFCVEETDYPTFDLFLHRLDARDSHLLSVNFRTYLDLLLQTRGTFGWVYRLADIDLDAHPDLRATAESFDRRMQRLFPETNLDALLGG